MKDRASGSIGRRLIWSGRVVFIGQDAAFEGVIANAVAAGFHRVTHRAPSRSGQGTGWSGRSTSSQLVRWGRATDDSPDLHDAGGVCSVDNEFGPVPRECFERVSALRITRRCCAGWPSTTNASPKGVLRGGRVGRPRPEDARTRPSRRAGLVTVGGAVPSYGAEADAGATAAEIVEVLFGIVSALDCPALSRRQTPPSRPMPMPFAYGSRSDSRSSALSQRLSGVLTVGSLASASCTGFFDRTC
jgi:hypothetical protein